MHSPSTVLASCALYILVAMCVCVCLLLLAMAMTVVPNEVMSRYQFGQGVIKNAKRAAELYLMAAQQGLPQAMNNLGMCSFIATY